jgi:hypothetical protein
VNDIKSGQSMKCLKIFASLSLLIVQPVLADEIFGNTPLPTLELKTGKAIEACIPSMEIEDVSIALSYYTGCTLNQFMQITGQTPESSVAMPNNQMLYKFVARAEGFFTPRRTCIIQLETDQSGFITGGGFQSAAKGLILNGRGHCLKILKGKKRNGGILPSLKDVY